MSSGAAAILAGDGLIDMKELESHRAKEYDVSLHNTDALTGTAQACLHLCSMCVSGVAELFVAPARGLTSIMWTLPKAAVGVVGDLFEGFDNTPKLIGSDVRERGKIKDTKSGFKEGGLGFFYGLVDGISGLVTEPYVGAKREGPAGLAKGIGRSYVNMLARPAAGSLGLFVHPVVGMMRSMKRKLGHSPDDVLRSGREHQGRIELSTTTEAYRRGVVEAFDRLKPLSGERKRAVKARAKRWLLTGELLDDVVEKAGSQGQGQVTREGEGTVRRVPPKLDDMRMVKPSGGASV